jgi:hypothetical protein
MQLPPTAFNGFEDRSLKCLAGVFREEQFFAVIAATNDVIDGSWELNALFAWHDPMMAESVGRGNR